MAALIFLTIVGAGQGHRSTGMTEVARADAVPLAAVASATLSPQRHYVLPRSQVVVVGVVSGIIALTCGGYWLSNFTQAYCMVLAVLGCALRWYGQLGLVSPGASGRWSASAAAG